MLDYWGKSDTTVQFCEKEYVHSKYIAEYQNTLSAMMYILVGIPLIFTKIRTIGISVVLLGISTMVMHGTMRHYGQLMDEGSMLIFSWLALRELGMKWNKNWLYLILLFYLINSKKYWCFVSLFTSLQIFIFTLAWKYKVDEGRKYFIRLYLIFLLMGLVCWILDMTMCEYIPSTISLHACWHVLTAMSILFGGVALVMGSSKDQLE